MAIVRDNATGLYMDIRRLVTGRGATAADAKTAANRAEAALRAQVVSALPIRRVRYSVLGKITGLVERP